jgi:NitT/TauT family transport system substrate-binding protein
MRVANPQKIILASLTFLVLLTIFLISRNGPSNNNSSTAKQPFDIGMVTFAGYAPLYLAKEKGFFGDLDVNLQRIEETPSIRAGITKGDLEAYLATPDIALDTNAKPPGRAVWAINESAGGDGVVVAGDIRNLSDLKGIKVAAEPGLPPNFVLLYLLYQNGMSGSDINFQDMSTQNAAAAFTSGSVDAAAIYEPYLSQAMKQRKGSRVVISSAQTPDMIVDLIFVRDDIIASRSADVAKVIDGWRKAQSN